MSSPMKAVLDVLASLGEIEWARCVGRDSPPPSEPPFIAWRFKRRDEKAEERIAKAVHAYSGTTRWTIKKGERNWVIEPVAFEEFGRDFRVDVEALRAFGSTFPTETRVALDDAVKLAEHLRTCLLPP